MGDADPVQRLNSALEGRYHIERELGEGGMATVYLAADLKHERKVALKVLKPELAAVVGADRFLAEIKTTANLQHPHILALFDSGEADGLLFYVMPYVEGESLRARLEEEGQLPLDEALGIAREMADALKTAHDQGITHRDIKPENVLLSRGHAVITDFGIALSVDANEAMRLTETGALLGTPKYMSPEQATEDHAIDHRSDLYALGCVLYEMLTGEPPYTGSTFQAVLAKKLIQSPASLTTLLPGIPEAVEAAVVRALSPIPADRHESVEAFVAELDAARGERPPPPERPKYNLPRAVDTFVGRERELGELERALEDSRVVTLTGVGGTGKTRLALESAERLLPRFKDGVWLVELAPVLESTSVPQVIAEVVRARQHPGKTLAESIAGSLEYRELLLIIDNCEHVLDAVAEVVQPIVARCPHARILATSREGLGVRGEQILPVPSLERRHGVELFQDRTKAGGGPRAADEEVVGRLVDRLDGIPLAIELAAARARSMTPDQIEQRLDDRFRLLRGRGRGRMERHQTLRNMVAWSYELLEPLRQRVFDRLSVFAGGFQLEAASGVAAGDDIDAVDVEDALAALVDRSMVIAEPTVDGTRYKLLETLRQFGEEKLVAAGHSGRFRDVHLDWFRDFARRATEGMWSEDDQRWWRAGYRDFENLRVAAYRAFENEDVDAASDVLSAAGELGFHGMRYECADWCLDALRLQPEPWSARPLAVLLLCFSGRFAEAQPLLESMPPPDLEGGSEVAWLRAAARYVAAMTTGSSELAAALHAYRKAASDDLGPGVALYTEASTAVGFLVMGDMAGARLSCDATLEMIDSTRNVLARGVAHFYAGRVLTGEDPTRAFGHFDRATQLLATIGADFWRRSTESEMAAVAVHLEDAGTAARRLVPAVRYFMDSDDRMSVWTSLHHLCFLLLGLGREGDASWVWSELKGRPGLTSPAHRDALQKRLGEPGEPQLSDHDLTKRVRGVLDAVESEVLSAGR